MTIFNILTTLIFAIAICIMLWFVIYITIGMNCSGKRSSLKTTNEVFVSVVIFIGLVLALGYIVVRDIL
jgi:hypothetical protein